MFFLCTCLEILKLNDAEGKQSSDLASSTAERTHLRPWFIKKGKSHRHGKDRRVICNHIHSLRRKTSFRRQWIIKCFPAASMRRWDHPQRGHVYLYSLNVYWCLKICQPCVLVKLLKYFELYDCICNGAIQIVIFIVIIIIIIWKCWYEYALTLYTVQYSSINNWLII